MPLVLGMNLDKDNEIWLDDLLVTVDKILSPTQTQITVHGDFLTEQKVLNTMQMVMVTNRVKMMLGTDTNRDGFVRVLVDAPRSIKIERGLRKHDAENASV